MARADKAAAVAEIADLASNIWISIVVRDGLLLPVLGDTELRAGDLVTLLIDGDVPDEVTEMFTEPAQRDQ